MEEKTDTKRELPKAFFVKLLGLIVVIMGCLSLFFLLFYYPILSSLGFIASSVISLIISFLMMSCAKSGFDCSDEFIQEGKTRLFEMLNIYIVSFFCTLISIVFFLKVVIWAAFYFLKLDVHLFDFPK